MSVQMGFKVFCHVFIRISRVIVVEICTEINVNTWVQQNAYGQTYSWPNLNLVGCVHVLQIIQNKLVASKNTYGMLRINRNRYQQKDSHYFRDDRITMLTMAHIHHIQQTELDSNIKEGYLPCGAPECIFLLVDVAGFAISTVKTREYSCHCLTTQRLSKLGRHKISTMICQQFTTAFH